MAFEGFGPAAREWFLGLEADNSKAYFEANKPILTDQIRQPLEQMLNAAAFRMEGQVKLFRPHRDVRFSKDKSPYKTTASGYVHSVPGSQSGGYFAVNSQGATCATGLWELSKDQLDRARQTINEKPDAAQALREAIASGEAQGLHQWGEALKTAPRGFDKDHEYIELLRKKNFVLARTTDDWSLIGSDHIYDWALEGWAAAQPLVDWCDKHIGPSMMSEKEQNKRR